MFESEPVPISSKYEKLYGSILKAVYGVNATRYLPARTLEDDGDEGRYDCYFFCNWIRNVLPAGKAKFQDELTRNNVTKSILKNAAYRGFSRLELAENAFRISAKYNHNSIDMHLRGYIQYAQEENASLHGIVGYEKIIKKLLSDSLSAKTSKTEPQERPEIEEETHATHQIILQGNSTIISSASPFIDKPWLDIRNRKYYLGLFSKELADHPEELTSIVDYYDWHATEKEWVTGNGLLVSATTGELYSLWTNHDYFVQYEAQLLNFVANGGTVQRTFLLGKELVPLEDKQALCRVLRRQLAFNFNPKVIGIYKFQEAKRKINIECDVAGALNNNIALFLKLQHGKDPLLVRSIDKKLVHRVSNAVNDLYKNARRPETFLKHVEKHMPDNLDEIVENDVWAVELAAGVR